MEEGSLVGKNTHSSKFCEHQWLNDRLT